MGFDIKKFESKIIAKAWKDPVFKKELLKNPTQTIYSFLKAEKIDAPKNYKFEVVEAEEKTMVIVLPASPAKMQNLSDTELESIAAAGICQAGCPFTALPSSWTL